MTTTRFISVNSNSRNLINFPQCNQFTIPTTIIRQMSSIQLVHAIIPNLNSVTNNPGLTLNLSLDNRNNAMLTDAYNTTEFCFIPLLPYNNNYLYAGINDLPVIQKFKSPIDVWSFSIKLNDISGNLFDFGSNLAISYFVFKIECN